MQQQQQQPTQQSSQAIPTPMHFEYPLPPVQFSTAPPTGLHVHKPRRSSSPPAKMFLMEQNNDQPRSSTHAFSATLSASAFTSSSGSTMSEMSQEQYSSDARIERAEERRERRRIISPRKRYHRQARAAVGGGGGGGHQRPCLDFEKMQQVKFANKYHDALSMRTIRNGAIALIIMVF